MSEIKKKIKTAIEESLKLSTIHGLPNIVTNQHLPIKILWTISVLVSTALCFYVIIASITTYLEYNVVSKVSIVGETVSLFPTISICNLASFVTYNSSIVIENLFNNSYFSQFLNPFDNGQPIEPYKYVAQYFSKIYSENIPIEIKKSYGIQLDQILLTCMFSGVACNVSDFEWYYNSLYGNCYRFNSGLNSSLKVITNTGKLNGLRLEFYLGSKNYVEINQQSTGLLIFINNKTIYPTAYEGLDISTSTETNIAVTRSFFNKLGSPYSDCISDSNENFYLKLVELNGKYRYRDCVRFCFQEALIQKCKCQDAISPIVNSSIKTCTTLDEIFLCEYPFYSKFFASNLDEKCPYCKFECQSMKYGYSSSYNEYPSEEYANFLLRLNKIKSNNITTFEQLKRNVLSLNIYYNDLQYYFIEEIPSIDLYTLISGIGGTMGLFLGMSFLSILETIGIFFEILCLLKENFKKNKKCDPVLIFDHDKKTLSDKSDIHSIHKQ